MLALQCSVFNVIVFGHVLSTFDTYQYLNDHVLYSREFLSVLLCMCSFEIRLSYHRFILSGKRVNTVLQQCVTTWSFCLFFPEQRVVRFCC
jgi:hypothetical protein